VGRAVTRRGHRVPAMISTKDMRRTNPHNHELPGVSDGSARSTLSIIV